MPGLSFSEKRELLSLINRFKSGYESRLEGGDFKRLLTLFRSVPSEAAVTHDVHGFARSILILKSLLLFAEEVDADRNCLAAIALVPLFRDGVISRGEIEEQWGSDVPDLINAIISVEKFTHRGHDAGYDNLRGLLLSIVNDVRVIIILTVANLVRMREINLHPDTEWVRSVALEAHHIYSQLAHRLGLYKLKGELEDLSLKYTDRATYKSIANKLNETKRSRDAYIASFITPVKQRLEEAGLKFEIKGRTKSISSIWNKMKKQKTDVNGIYDLFAIRVIIDSPGDRGKEACWMAYSILVNMYQADEKRMRDWLSFPKSNGYESLHATVRGPGDKWVEVQFRTREMDEVAERGLAAHWRYKGGKVSEADSWMAGVREILEAGDEGAMDKLRQTRQDVAGGDVYVFTPKGMLFRLNHGATVLDFAFRIHTRVGAQCTGALVNGVHRKINHPLASGDSVQILTSPLQQPRASWLDIVATPHARNKIRQSLNEEKLRKASLGKEAFERRARNRKVEIDEAALNKFIRKEGYRHATDFFADIEEGKFDSGRILSRFIDYQAELSEHAATHISASEFRMQEADENMNAPDTPLLVDGKPVGGLRYRLSKCCNPVFGDPIFGFFSADGALKIHKKECPNVRHIATRYPGRVVPVSWSGVSGNAYLANLQVVGSDDLGIINNITSIISKDMGIDMRNLQVNSRDGIFNAVLTVSVKDLSQLNGLIRKLDAVKGIKSVERS